MNADLKNRNQFENEFGIQPPPEPTYSEVKLDPKVEKKLIKDIDE